MSEIKDAKGSNINMKMIELGLAALYPFQKDCGKFKNIENKAKSIKIGIWSDPNFELPWDYRKRMVHKTQIKFVFVKYFDLIYFLKGIGFKGKTKQPMNKNNNL